MIPCESLQFNIATAMVKFDDSRYLALRLMEKNQVQMVEELQVRLECPGQPASLS